MPADAEFQRDQETKKYAHWEKLELIGQNNQWKVNVTL
jgi:hypothetical protein